MNVSARAFLTTGIAAIGAGAIALTPIQPLPDHTTASAPNRAVESLAVKLAATIDPITPWVDTFKTAVANIETLGKFYGQQPLPLLTTIGANFGTYLNELTNGNANLIPEQISNNIKTFFQAPWTVGEQVPVDAPPAVPDPVLLPLGEYASGTTPLVGAYPRSLLQGIVGFYLIPQSNQVECRIDGNCLFVQAAPALNFLSAPYSGQVIALAGVTLSPVVQLVRSFTAVGDLIKNGEALAAINELINIPANVTNAYLNGAGTWDLTGIVQKIAPTLPIEKFGLNLGGLLNAVPFDGSLKNPESFPVTKYTGGVGFDALALEAKLGSFTIGGPGLPNGWAGSVIGLGQFLGEKMLVTPPAEAVAPTAAAAVAPKAAAAVEAPAVPATDEAPATPVEAEAPAPVIADIPDVPEASAPEAPAPADTPAPAHRGGGNDKSDNSGHSSGHGHRGAA